MADYFNSTIQRAGSSETAHLTQGSPAKDEVWILIAVIGGVSAFLLGCLLCFLCYKALNRAAASIITLDPERGRTYVMRPQVERMDIVIRPALPSRNTAGCISSQQRDRLYPRLADLEDGQYIQLSDLHARSKLIDPASIVPAPAQQQQNQNGLMISV